MIEPSASGSAGARNSNSATGTPFPHFVIHGAPASETNSGKQGILKAVILSASFRFEVPLRRVATAVGTSNGGV